jgi:uracil-DNA glycosylase family 4
LDKVYITNVVKCSTPRNRAPSSSEIASCLKWLEEEVKIISPRKIVVLGALAGGGIKDKFEDIPKSFLRHPIAAIRGGRALEYSYELEEAVVD